MAKAINLVTGARYESADDKDEIKTVWLLNTLTASQYMSVTEKGYVDNNLIIRYGLSGWENFVDADGADIPFSDEAVDMIPPPIYQDLLFEIQAMSGLMEKERKNS